MSWCFRKYDSQSSNKQFHDNVGAKSFQSMYWQLTFRQLGPVGMM